MYAFHYRLGIGLVHCNGRSGGVAGIIWNANHIKITLHFAVLAWCTMHRNKSKVKLDLFAIQHQAEIIFIHLYPTIRPIIKPAVAVDPNGINCIITRI